MKPVPHATSRVRLGGSAGDRLQCPVPLLLPAGSVRSAYRPRRATSRRTRGPARGSRPSPRSRVRNVLPLESVPNFSEGRDRATIEAVGAALAAAGARLLDVHADADHNRSVFTLVGEDDALVAGLVAGVECARDRIDLRRHEGAHPRVGATDVVPLVPIAPEDMQRARTAATGGRRADRRARSAGLPLRRSWTGPGVLPARRAGGAPTADRRGRARAGLRAGAARPGGGSGARRRPPSADRLQRQPAERRRRGRAVDRGGRAGERRRVPRRPCARARRCRAPGSSR